MKTSILAADLYDVMQLLLEKLGLDKEHTVQDIGQGVTIADKRDGDTWRGMFVTVPLRTTGEGGTHAVLEIPVDYRTKGGTGQIKTYEAWEESRKK